MSVGHTVTIVDEAQWRAMSTEDFADFDAIVIGDAGCDFDDGDLLEPVNDTKATWSPAVTGHLFLHTFDNVYHFNQNFAEGGGGGGTSPEQFQAMVDLAVRGMEFAASAGSTGLYYANGCRGFSLSGPPTVTPPRGSDVEILRDLEFLSLLTFVDVGRGDSNGDTVEIVAPEHPAIFFNDAALSNWSNSYHAHFESFGLSFDILTVDPAGFLPPNGDLDAIIVATPSPVGQVIVFADGFESGTTGAWSEVTGIN